ncbi:RHS repeat-associated core domain-containing protein [Chryseobacterium viscerum]|uniref:RHS repeat-associated core domain-containing protein n=1 Tax=Chryseobacterium viscerum TaxID=1037377 RepID=UPI0022226269|nr:RHS repeat-associated core domain-containing protein [Chryseobacterium viscerum]MCW1963387.1 type IV secretion protein Rhs [Chryseobacterium viscerum]
MKFFSSLMLFLCSVWGFSQTILYRAESTSRTVQDPQSVIMTQGFQAKSGVSNPFLAKIGPATDNPGGGPTNSQAGINNPSRTIEIDSIKFHDTKGNIEVNGGGQLQFTLPIALPPGIKTVAPQTNLVYTSSSGNGIAGYGWNLSGLTSISRVGKTIEKDGKPQGIQWDYTDYYSFNGERLVLKSGEYGKDGAEYVPAKYSNIKIKSVGVNPEQNGPLYFEITFEDGSKAWYGLNADSRTSAEYNISKWKDVQGNYISYNYVQGKGVTTIHNIAWGGNEQQNKSHFNSIEFTYADRTLKEQAYTKGLTYTQSMILSEIKVNSNGNLFKKYSLEYVQNKTNYQFLSKITESNSAGANANPITIQYQQDPSATNTLWQDSRYDDLYDRYQEVISGDFNGDGKLDFIKDKTLMINRLENSGQFYNLTYQGKFLGVGTGIKNNILLNKSVFFTSQTSFEEKNVLIRTYEVIDGKAELVSSKKIDLSSYPQLFTEIRGTLYNNLIIEYNDLKCKIKEADFDGDGVSDFLLSIENVAYGYPNGPGEWSEYFDSLYLSETFYYNTRTGVLQKQDSDEFEKFKIADFKGEGKSNLLKIQDNNIYIYELNTQNKFVQAFSTTKESYNDVIYLGDFNGDGKTDIMAPIADASSDWRMYLSTGAGFVKHYYSNLFLYEPWWEGSLRKKRQIQRTYSTSDLNKDGKSDLLIFESQRWNRDGWTDWNNPDSSYGFNFLRNDGVDSNGKPIFNNAHSLAPVELNWDGEIGNYSMYGEQFRPLFGSFRIAQLNTDFAIIHRTKMITWDLGSKLNVISKIKSIRQAGIKTVTEYSPLTSSGNIYQSFYTTNPIAYPYINITENYSYFVVSKLIQGDRKQEFRYRDLIGNLHGKGMIGFRQMARSTFFSDALVNTKVWNGFEINPANEGLPYKDWSIRTADESKIFPADISLNNTQLLSFKQYDYKIDKLLNGAVVPVIPDTEKSKAVLAINPYITTSKDFLKNIKTVHTVEEYDNLYLPKKSTVNINDGFSVSTSELEYFPHDTTAGTNYSIGKPKTKTTTVQAYGDTQSTKEEYIYNNNLLKTYKISNRDNTGALTEIYNYDNFGNVIQKVNLNSIDSQKEITNYQYDDKGRFVIKSTDDLGLETNTLYNDWGLVTKKTDALGNTLENEYDAWGKLMKSKTNISGVTTYEYVKDNLYNSVVITYDPSGDISKKYTNKWGQEYKESSKAFKQGQYISQDIVYDVLGRKTAESEPYFEGQSSNKWNTISFDDSVFPARITTTAFNGKQVKVSVSGNATTEEEINGNKRITTKTTDALGNVISTTDKGGTIQFSYNAAGEQIQAKYNENIVTTKYDTWGRKSEFNDPSNGLYKYEYHGMGQLKKVTSPKGTKEYTYNNQRQLTSQKEISTADSGQATNKVISYSYDSKGRLISKSGTSNGKNYSSSIVYDPQGRLLSSSESSNGKYFIQKGIVYDDKARVVSYEKQLYSSGILTKVDIENVYSDWNGELYQIKDKNSGKILWQLNEINAKGQVLKSKLGTTEVINDYDLTTNVLKETKHGSPVKSNLLHIKYQFDALKNQLDSRITGGDFNINELFKYDDNNRLISWTNPANGQENSNVYDNKGRILENNQIGKIKFENSTKIYQATGMTLNPAGEQNYQNDLIQSISYNENNDPVFIDGEKGDVAFQYGLASMRQRVTYGGNFDTDKDGKFTKYYNEDGSYEIVRDNTTGKEKHILYIDGSPYESNIIYVKNYTEENGSYKFLHKDYLGSILAISDEAGNKLEQRHFDAWGNFTHLQIGSGAVETDINKIKQIANSGGLLLERGYTSHEHFMEVGIIHMNGRLYDPLLRRFLNADEFIQDPYNTQNYNKYGYVMNNPLMFNDFTGEIMGWDDALIAIGIAIFTSVATDYYLNRPINIGSMFQSVAMSMMSMGISNGIGDIFKAGGEVAKALGKTGTIIARAGAHALAQGTLSLVQGGNFWSGLLSGAFASISNDLLNFASNNVGDNSILKSDGFALLNGAVSGGVGSVLGGGNFWVGAGQGLMVTAFNYLKHKPPTTDNLIDDMEKSKIDPAGVPDYSKFDAEVAKMRKLKTIAKLAKKTGYIPIKDGGSSGSETRANTSYKTDKIKSIQLGKVIKTEVKTTVTQITIFKEAFTSYLNLAGTFVHEYTHAIDYISGYFEGKLSKLGKRETERLMEERAYGSGAKAGDLIQKQQYQDWLKRNGY